MVIVPDTDAVKMTTMIIYFYIYKLIYKFP